MKRLLRAIVPILLTIAVLCCAAWYLFVYDRDFTRDTLLHSARYFESSGNLNVSAWLYELAYRHSSQEPDIAIELSRQYRADGNYTKAEYTLSRAIAETGSPDLYAELCAVYVAQDKLLDAVTMLDNIADPAVKEAMDAKRPAAPDLTPQPGLYSQYISVGAEAEEGNIHLSLTKEYPSVSFPYSEPIALPAGQTTVTALAVSEDGLVSKLAAGSYTIGGIVEPVTLTDPVIDSMVRIYLMVAEDTVLYTNDLWNITELTIPKTVSNCEDLAYFPRLRSLTIQGATDTDLSLLSSITALEELSINGSRLDENEINAICTLTNLKKLTLTNCSLTSVAALEALTSLDYLDLSQNSIRNISTLSTLTGLKHLNLANNALTNITPLSSLTELQYLDVSHNSITSLVPLASATKLQQLYAASNQLTDISSLQVMGGLTSLDLSHNSLTDISALSKATSISQLRITNNSLTDISALSALTKLQKLYLSYNQIEELPSFSKDCSLMTIDISYNNVKSLDALAGLTKLNDVFVDYNDALKSLKPLDDCPLLVLVNAYGTRVTEVSFLTEKSVLVNFDPTA